MAEYDYIICGGGTSGCVVAARLAEEPHVRVLVIEAGEHNKDLENTRMVGGCAQLIGTAQDWNFKTVPQKHANDREIELQRGKFLGGSSGVNGTLCIRGCKQDFDDWDLPGWSGEEVFEAMRRTETFHDKDWFEAAGGAHGRQGPLHTEPHDLAPISKLVLQSMQSKGLQLDHDMFSTGDTAHGCGHVPRTHYRGLRTTGADFITNENHRDTIDIVVNATVDKVNLTDTSHGWRATSVDVVLADGQRKTFVASREIIVSGGSYCTPAILMRSGIGPRQELEKNGICCKVPSPGVGRNLQDHLIVFTFYEVSEPGLTTDEKIWHGNALAKSYASWKEDKSGFLSTFPFGAFAYARLDDRLHDADLWQRARAGTAPGRDPMGLTTKQPHVEYFNTECYAGPRFYDQRPVNGEHAFAMITELFSPRSRGTVTLNSKDPLDNPVIDCNYLADPLDVLVLAEGARLGNEIIMNGESTKSVVKGSWPGEWCLCCAGGSHMSTRVPRVVVTPLTGVSDAFIADLTHHTYKSREDWVPHVRQHATTCYHPAGTARMGKAGDEFAVLNEKLQVRGVQGLRVADCSVMPNLHGGHTQMVAYAIGERAADFIKHDGDEVNDCVCRIDSVQDVKC